MGEAVEKIIVITDRSDKKKKKINSQNIIKHLIQITDYGSCKIIWIIYLFLWIVFVLSKIEIMKFIFLSFFLY